jgi:hypothetical protein
MDGKTALAIYNKMRNERGNMPALWQEAIRFCYPWERPVYDEGGRNDKMPGKRRTTPVCSYPAIFAQRLASALHNAAFPSVDHWFTFGYSGINLSENFTLNQWCMQARDKVHAKIRQGSNFYQESHALMMSLAVLGTAGFHTYYKGGRIFFRHFPIHKNFYIARNSDGEVDMVAILHEWTAKEAVEEYGDNVSDEIKRELTAGSAGLNQTYNFVQLIYPKKTYGEKYNVLKGEKPYGDITIEENTGKVVRVSGHIQFPFAVPRFFTASDDLYGRSPAMNGMSAIKSANMLRKTYLDAGMRAIKPALFINALINKPISTEAGALNYVPNFDPNSIWTYPSATNFNVGKDLMAEILEELKQAFYIDVFQAIEEGQYMTATEITERKKQKSESIGSVVSRLQYEFSQKVILQVLNLLVENGEIEPPPVEANGLALEVTYESGIDAMLRQGIAAKTMQFVAQSAQVAQAYQMNTDLNAIVNMEEMLKTLANCAMLPSNYFNTPEVQADIRERMAQNAQAVQEAQARVQNSQAALNSAKAQAIATGKGYNGV